MPPTLQPFQLTRAHLQQRKLDWPMYVMQHPPDVLTSTEEASSFRGYLENIPAMSSLTLADEKEAASHNTTVGVGAPPCVACFRFFRTYKRLCILFVGKSVPIRDSFIYCACGYEFDFMLSSLCLRSGTALMQLRPHTFQLVHQLCSSRP